MSKYKYALFLILTFGLFTLSVSAATCSYEERAELNSEISNITANYEVITIELENSEPPDALLETEEEENYVSTTDALQVNILNLTENVYAVVTNNYNDEELTYHYSDTDNGNVAIVWRELGELVTFTIQIYSSDATSCADTLLRTLRVSLPRYNEYAATFAICEQVPDYYLCQRYVYYDEIEFGEFMDRVTAEIERVNQEAEENKDDLTWYEEIGHFISENRTPIIIGVVVVLIITGVIVVVVIRRRRRSEL